MGRAREATGAVTVFYCATCGVVYAEDRDGRTGLRFLCPNDAPDRPAHLASVVKGPSGRRWLSVQRWLARYDDRYSPRNWFGMWGGLFAGRVGFYVVVRLLALLAALALVVWDRGPGPTVAGVVVSAFAVGSVLDILLVHTYIAFVRRSTADPLRATVLALFSFAQLAVAFVLEHPYVTSTIIGPRTMEHLEGLLPAVDLQLDTAVLDQIDKIVPSGSSVNPPRDQPDGTDKIIRRRS